MNGGFDRKMVRIDDELNIMKITVEKQVMKLKWVDASENWIDLDSREEMKTLKLRWDTALANITGGKGNKGKNGK